MSETKAFPSVMPLEKPDRPLSAAMHRMYDVWDPHEDRNNPFYSNFKYSQVTGIGEEIGVTRRDPSAIIKENDTYYVWYTKRQTESDPVGAKAQTDTLPAVDWDLADLWYATSNDGFEWQEQGVAVARAPKGDYGDRSVCTPSILVFKERYYLYFQTYSDCWIEHDCMGVSMAWADSPDGPWHRLDGPVVDQGAAGEWDSCSVHDPFPLVYKGQIWLYYKGQPLEPSTDTIIRAQGVAVADKPEGPFTKSPLNPVLNSGHETCLYPFGEGIAAFMILDGPEKNTIQYASDGINFEPKSHVQMPPVAPGPFCPDLFTGNGNGRGITWGLCHFNSMGDASGEGKDNYNFLARFDCDLSTDANRPEFKVNNIRFNANTYFQQVMRLPDTWKQRILQEQAVIDSETKA